MQIFALTTCQGEGICLNSRDFTYRYYCPEFAVTRAQMAVFLLKSIYGASYTPPDVLPTLPDTAGHWAENWIEALKSTGITGGFPDGTYRPETSVTRAQMAVFLLKAVHGSAYTPPDVAPTFSDTAGHWAKNWIEALRTAGITGGFPDGTYRPEEAVTRGQMAVFLVKAFGLP
ncbi:MAG: S-layer homology domain-containing protein [Anaerolineales bacterium]